MDELWGEVLEVAGIVGSINNGFIDLSFNDGTVTAAKNAAGGIAGSAKSSVIRRTYNVGTITAHQDSAGGIAGYACGTTNIDKCYNKGEVKAGNNSGGIIGYIALPVSTVSIMNVYNTGRITGQKGGGLVGRVTSGKMILAFSYTIGSLPSSGGHIAGSINHRDSFNVTNLSYYLTNAAVSPVGEVDGGGTAETGLTREKSVSSFNADGLSGYDGWDSDTWEVVSSLAVINGVTKRPILKEVGSGANR